MMLMYALPRYMGLRYIPYVLPDRKVHGTNMGPTWGRQDPGGPHVGPMNVAIMDNKKYIIAILSFVGVDNQVPLI